MDLSDSNENHNSTELSTENEQSNRSFTDLDDKPSATLERGDSIGDDNNTDAAIAQDPVSVRASNIARHMKWYLKCNPVVQLREHFNQKILSILL